jgi:hypothetical protein
MSSDGYRLPGVPPVGAVPPLGGTFVPGVGVGVVVPVPGVPVPFVPVPERRQGAPPGGTIPVEPEARGQSPGIPGLFMAPLFMVPLFMVPLFIMPLPGPVPGVVPLGAVEGAIIGLVPGPPPTSAA